ncbi:hypothetical protein [Cyclobacterium jeungdonense]|uniref:Outer membrane protein beta-barrel domain-containing protein n=1 Tax=Cyclobacterium jeungdonense TaxID=708087 RepID=A0ABT8CCU1_9BACT|nr:hypothetical protein [Cyclobacterium jeungdonense]MDN3690608.1 hypothetical protein [Cyclobacterium jeungdonense]
MRFFSTNLILIFLMAFLAETDAYSQSKGNLWLATGLQLHSSRDRGFSPMIYSGNRTFSLATFDLESTNKSEVFQFEFGYGPLTNRFGNSLNSLSLGLLNYTFYHKESRAERGLHWGWSNQNVFNIRRHNGFSNYSLRYDYFTTVGPALRYVYPFEWKGQSFKWQTVAHWQLVGFQIKSGYIGADPEGISEGDSGFRNFLRAVDPFFAGRDWSMGLESSLLWTLPTGNSLGIRYRPEISTLGRGQPVHRIGQAILVMVNVRLW